MNLLDLVGQEVFVNQSTSICKIVSVERSDDYYDAVVEDLNFTSVSELKELIEEFEALASQFVISSLDEVQDKILKFGPKVLGRKMKYFLLEEGKYLRFEI